MERLPPRIFSPPREKLFRNARMLSPARLLVLSGLFFAGCGTARDVAVTSFRVLDAPANFVRRRIDPSQTTTTTTVETTESSDVVTPGRPLTPPPLSAATQRRPSGQAPTNASAGSTNRSPRTPASATQARPDAAATPRPSAAQIIQFPTARPVAGRPGYVYSIDPKGGIVDVTGYKSGDKAKDPYTQQIFIVP